MQYYIITGTSKGLGREMAKKLIKPGNHLFCISRNPDRELSVFAEKLNVKLDHFQYDLDRTWGINGIMEAIFTLIREAVSITLINNAGIIEPIKPVEGLTEETIRKNISVNLIAPMVLVSSFTRLAGDIPCRKTVINISSGAAKNPYYGWGCYCSAKAGLDMFSRTAGLEQQNREFPVKVISLAPGIIDTDMQASIRSSKEEDFTLVERFKRFKEDGKLIKPEVTAERIIKLLEDEGLENGCVYDIRDFYA
jgi:benzil reductase ((S)-benzoin forming)